MEAKEKWNTIVDFFKKNENCKEEVIQKDWEAMMVELFGYSKLFGELKTQFSIQIGSRERIVFDIVISNDNKNLFVIELKQHKYSRDSVFETQLITYLKQFKSNFGILICDKIYLYDYVYSKNDSEQINGFISFKKDDADGIKFVELLQKSNFDIKKIKIFINELLEKNKKEVTEDLKKEKERKSTITPRGNELYQRFFNLYNKTLGEMGRPFFLSRGYPDGNWRIVNHEKPDVYKYKPCLSINYKKRVLMINIMINNDVTLFERLKSENKITKSLGFQPFFVKGIVGEKTRRIVTNLEFLDGSDEEHLKVIKKSIPIVKRYLEVFKDILE